MLLCRMILVSEEWWVCCGSREGNTWDLYWTMLPFSIRLPDYACKFLEICLMVSADHGPAVSGAHNTIVTARAGKDLVSSLTSGLLTIVSTFICHLHPHWVPSLITGRQIWWSPWWSSQTVFGGVWFWYDPNGFCEQDAQRTSTDNGHWTQSEIS